MQMHQAKRVEIIIESMMQRRLMVAMQEAGVTGYSVLPVSGGSGRSGEWTREGGVGRSGGMVAFVCLIRPERLEPLLDAVFEVVEHHIGVISVSDTQVLRAERF